MTYAFDKNKSHLTWVFWGLILLAILIAIVFVFFRIVDGDEGFYLSAASMVKNGLRPYLDFFFPQMPVLPIIQAPFADHGWTTLYIIRFLGFFCHLLLSLLIYYFCRNISGDRKIGLAAMFLVLLSGPLLTWNSLAKPFPFTNLFLTASFITLVLALRDERTSYRQIGLAFMLLSIAINIRSIFVIFVPVYFFLGLVYLHNRRTLRLAFLIPAALIGLLIPSIYAIRLFVESPDLFFFNNLGFHFLRDYENTLSYVIIIKVLVIIKILIQPHFIIPIVLAVWSLAIINSKQHRHEYSNWHKMVFHLATAIAVLIFIIYMVPHPVHVQYFNQILPFIIISSLPAIRLVMGKALTIKVGIALIYLFSFLLYPALYIIDIRGKHGDFTVANVKRTTQAIQANSSEDDFVLSEWVGHNVLSERKTVRGGEFVGYQYVFATPEVPFQKYRLLTNEKINDLLSQKVPKLLVIRNYPIPEWKKELDKNYQMLVQINKVLIYERKPDTPVE